ncbi:MAG TPA: DNA double-strand break repair nuclease NurA [Acidimicrobiales bacterium]|nr:DNA double-strand break repair nuclease NurA [Acidimicrobiales bacterium]
MASVDEVARHLAALLRGEEGQLCDPNGSDLDFFPTIEIKPLVPAAPAAEYWAVDGGQALVADARCLQVVATRAARTRWQRGRCTLEEEGDVHVHLLAGERGGPEAQRALAMLEAPVAAGTSVDLNLLRDWSEWRLVARCVEESGSGSFVLVDGDLQPDWRISARWLEELLGQARERGVHLVGVTKHSSLARGGAPLVGQLELEASARYGPRSRWWAPVARRRGDVGAGLLVVVARLDPDARFAFRVDLAGDAEAERLLGQLCALADDAAFPGYPYPLTIADRLASCPGWLREELWAELDSALSAAGVASEVRERAFTDRHALMERA